ncbi:hypothetical protein PIGHUM_00050 [Pigmentiphaga humi]|uniref:ChsH2 C-terminal OB-fold domain-containing protein n=1 Tax=Pigmentiphaga humi TaxID=2478468 RepID=A0A3P4AVD1_9BURK|nr:OB-fold domain-containing protein [Pigmentiphaga humi]VCU68004.1 hypothetical protein PIGHUM_00050 [Pigmentiphaga humi]
MSDDIADFRSGAAVPPGGTPNSDLARLDDAQFLVRDGQTMLKGSVSRSSGRAAFPERETCLVTGARDMEPATFGPRGTLYSFSTVHVSASRPTPYTIGYVDLDDDVRVLAEVRAPAGELSCDLPVVLANDGQSWFAVPEAAPRETMPRGGREGMQ